MSFNLSFAGHRECDTEEEARAFEEKIAEHARGIAATLEGLTSASGSFEHLGPMQLMPQPTDAPPAPEPEPEPAPVGVDTAPTYAQPAPDSDPAAAPPAEEAAP